MPSRAGTRRGLSCIEDKSLGQLAFHFQDLNRPAGDFGVEHRDRQHAGREGPSVEVGAMLQQFRLGRIGLALPDRRMPVYDMRFEFVGSSQQKRSRIQRQVSSF